VASRATVAAYVVVEGDPAWRIDRMASERLGLASRSRSRKLIRKGEILLNGAICESSRFVHPGDRLELLAAVEPPPVFEMPLRVVWSDPHFAVIEKPAGLFVSGNRHRTVEHALLFNLPVSDAPDALPFPRPVHRLDGRTSGLLAVARSASAQVGLGRAFENREVHKRYRAIVAGRLEGSGVVSEDVDGKVARSEWATLTHTRSLHIDWTTTVDVWPHSGRKHQIRVHMASLGHAVLGDDLYETGKVLRSQGLFLFAAELRLDHPVTGQPMRFELPEPPKFESYRAREERRWQAHQTRSSEQECGDLE